MAVTAMQKANLDGVEPDAHGRITKESAQLEGVSVTRVTFGPGARWSEDLKPCSWSSRAATTTTPN